MSHATLVSLCIVYSVTDAAVFYYIMKQNSLQSSSALRVTIAPLFVYTIADVRLLESAY